MLDQELIPSERLQCRSDVSSLERLSFYLVEERKLLLEPLNASTFDFSRSLKPRPVDSQRNHDPV